MININKFNNLTIWHVSCILLVAPYCGAVFGVDYAMAIILVMFPDYRRYRLAWTSPNGVRYYYTTAPCTEALASAALAALQAAGNGVCTMEAVPS